MKKIPLVAILILMLPSLRSFGEELEHIPSPRPSGWIVDLTGQIAEDTKTQVNKKIEELFQSSNVEIAVVVINTTDGVAPRTYATNLFNHWGIGDPTLNNGLLIMAALQDRKAEIILGDGIEEYEPVTDHIMKYVTVAHFKNGDANGAILKTVDACVRRLYVSPRQTDGIPSSPSSYEEKRSFFDNPVVFILTFNGGLIFIIWGFFVWRRFRPRTCERCQNKMKRLSEVKDDAFLKSVQQLEEKLGSVDYDVWLCESCRNTSEERYTAFFSGYSACPKCSGHTMESEDEILVYATESSTGRKMVHYNCLNCQHGYSVEKEIPRIQRSSSSSSSYSSSSSSGFSGGSSSGSGSSGSW